MLQRPQTLYLLGVLILSIFLLTGPLAVFTVEGGEMILSHSGITDREGEDLELATWPMTVLLILVAFLAFLNIFSYKNRVRQMRICIFLILLNVGVLGMILFYIYLVQSSTVDMQIVYQWRIVIPLISIILIYLGFRRIRRDELLVKAYDRIR